MTNHLGSPHIANSNASEHLKHLNMRSSSRSPKFDDEKKNDHNGNGVKPLIFDNNDNNNSFQSHFRRKSTFSMSCHYRNLSSLGNVNNLDSMFWEDDNLPSDYTLGKKKTITSTGLVRNMEEDPKERRFKLDRWLYPIFLDYHDEQTTEIVKG